MRPAVLELGVEHAIVPPEGGVAVDERDRGRCLPDRLGTAEEDLGHGDRVEGVRPGYDVAHVDLVRERLQGEDHVEVS